MFTENLVNIEKRMKLLNDFVFQKIFTENKELLIPLLSSILDTKIKNIEILPRDLLGNTIEDKFSILDIKAKTDKEEKINIEIQLANLGNMVHRTLFYWSRLYAENLRKGDNYRQLKRTVTINILGYRQFTDRDELHHIYQLRDAKDMKLLTDLMEIHFLEMPKFNSEEVDFSSPLNRWLLLFEEKPDPQKLKEVCEMDEYIQKTEDILEKLSMDDTVREAYLKREQELIDYYANIKDAREDGMEKGVKKGREEGKKETTKEIVIKMLQQNISDDLIKSVTDISDEALEKIKKELNS